MFISYLYYIQNKDTKHIKFFLQNFISNHYLSFMLLCKKMVIALDNWYALHAFIYNVAFLVVANLEAAFF